MKRIFICSPYRGDETLNTYNARMYCKQAIAQGFIPLAPHLYFTQFLEEDIEAERNLGISMGLELMKECAEVWAFYSPFDGPSAGMQDEMDYAEFVLNLPVRHIDPASNLSGIDYPQFVSKQEPYEAVYQPAEYEAADPARDWSEQC